MYHQVFETEKPLHLELPKDTHKITFSWFAIVNSYISIKEILTQQGLSVS